MRLEATRLTGAIMLSAALLTAAILLAVRAQAASGVTSGNFQSQVVTGPQCTSPVGLCTQGVLTGGLKGTFTFVATSLVQTADSPTTGVLLYTGDLSLQAKDGTLLCKDAGAFQTTGQGAVSSACALVSGTGSFAGATGVIQFVGTFSTAAGGDGDYRATIATP